MSAAALLASFAVGSSLQGRTLADRPSSPPPAAARDRLARTPGCSQNGAGVSSRAGGLLSGLSPVTVEAGTHPYAVTVSPDGRNVYVADYGSENVSQFARDPATGQLTALSPATVAAGVEPHSISVSGDGKNAYVANAGSNNVSQYARDPATGALTALPNGTVAAGGQPRSIAVSADGRNAYVANTGATEGSETAVSQYARNTQTGALTALSPATVRAGLAPRFVVVSGDGKSVYVAAYGAGSIDGFKRDVRTGALGGRTIYPTSEHPYSIAVSPDEDNVYVADYGAGVVSQFARTATTGRLQALNPAIVAAGEEPHSVVVTPDGENVYVTNGTPAGTVSQYERNILTGALSAIAVEPLEVGTEPTAIAVSPDGMSAYVTNHRSATVAQYERSAPRESEPTVRLTDVRMQGKRVSLQGVSSPSLIGREATIVLDGRTRVGHARVGLYGFFKAAVSPPPTARESDGARYSAQIGGLISSSVKLHRRLSLSPPVFSHGKIELSGRVAPPLATSVEPVTLWRHVGCRQPAIVGRTTSRPDGRYSFTLTEPKNAQTVFYSTTALVGQAGGARAVFKTFSIERLVQIR